MRDYTDERYEIPGPHARPVGREVARATGKLRQSNLIAIDLGGNPGHQRGGLQRLHTQNRIPAPVIGGHVLLSYHDHRRSELLPDLGRARVHLDRSFSRVAASQAAAPGAGKVLLQDSIPCTCLLSDGIHCLPLLTCLQHRRPWPASLTAFVWAVRHAPASFSEELAMMRNYSIDSQQDDLENGV